MASGRLGFRTVIKTISLGVSVALLAVVAFLGVRHIIAPHDVSQAELGQVTGNATIGGPFTLIDHQGNPVTDANFRGRYMLIYFGYTYCPDVCPTTLNRNMQALDSLGSAASQITPILISVDPERDTPEHLSEYVTFFDARLVGMTGSPQQVAEAAQAFKVYYAKAPGESGEQQDYLIDHSSFTYLVGPDGSFIDFYRHNLASEELAARLSGRL